MTKLYLFLFMTFLFCACVTGKRDKLESGVSRELAEKRKEMLSDLTYEVKFNIPDQLTETVEGEVKINFSLKTKDEVVIDFREDASKIRRVAVNGKECIFTFEQEHLMIPASAVVKGTNSVEIDFIAGEQSLNRNDDFLYTLLVPDRARTLFPCFDQPDLKALFTLSLEVPAAWEAVANSPVKELQLREERKRITFAQTEPLSTYLFSFVAGKLNKLTETRDGRSISLYHRETEPEKVAQAGVIFDQVFASLKWLEAYTDIPYPFAKYDLIILPGFQYGGMEHTGATLYNDKRMFLSEHPTMNEELSRMELIAHETAHMWFGDYVTMSWFDDVWTKEVFANYFSALMTAPQFPEVNHELNSLRSFFPAAYAEDRTLGTTAIKQPLDNLNNAGLIYGNIIYNKAPVVMKMMAGMIGEEPFREGIREYLKTYAYANATWDGLIAILDKYTLENLQEWSRVWINEKGMPVIGTVRREGKLTVVQSDPFQIGRIWPQTVRLMLIKGDSVKFTDVRLQGAETEVPDAAGVDYVIPNPNGQSYGYFVLDEATAAYCLENITGFDDPLTRLSVIMTLNENVLNGAVKPVDFMTSILNYLPSEENNQIYSAALGYVKSCFMRTMPEESKGMEDALLQISKNHASPEYRLVAFRALLDLFRTDSCTNVVFEMWDKQCPFTGLTIGESDYIKMARELAVRLPEKYDYIIDQQLGRITNPDRQREFSFTARALVPDTVGRDSFFYALLKAENRQVEPWTAKALYYLNHPLRQQQAVKFIRPSLDVLQEVQRTGDIFFPKNWISSCLSGHNSREVAGIVKQFLEDHPDYPPLLKNKILQSADPLYRLMDLK